MIQLEQNRFRTIGIPWSEANRTQGRVRRDALTDGCSFFVQTMEPVDKLLQCVDPCKDRELWVRENKTGEIRPVDVEIWPRLCICTLLHPPPPPSSHWSRGCSLRPDWNLLGSSLPPTTDPLVTPNRLGDDRSVSARWLFTSPQQPAWGWGQCLGSLVSGNDAMNEDVR